MNRELAIILICASVTLAERALPFIVFRAGKIPSWVEYLGKVLPETIMATLVIYCIRGISFASAALWVPQVAACAFVFVLHMWKKNTMLSITAGTVLCMVLTHIM